MKVVNKSISKHAYRRAFPLLVTASVLSLCAGSALAAASDLGGVAENITNTIPAIVKLITYGAYVAGVGFAVAAMLKFKAHKDNPTQIPLGTPIALLFIAGGLMFIPSVFNVAGKTLFGTNASEVQVSGTGA